MDWQKLLKEIYASGLTQKEMAKKLGVSQPWVNAVLQGRRGKKVSFDIGMAIKSLHETVKVKKIKQITYE
ncbi:helix-turn-helix domain-containing protein [Snodgrassella alvi]|jgi:transcriptional regulator with XRE-family HTH domain|uniref:HTH cro/C1-type domain-containing protein n=1 Tax=Snodgrassella alvi TaxID=1196083 RepID=A0A855FRR6_9NEIS|nr:helix-turn-helix transcriptional regulator [Snodgrassella alvi]PIT11653.1 hypothetical protein BGI30_04015 [Snodgrassella alvi]PIT55297.1 hypothetical protein BHC59_11085 [Snodgrassella alvi]PIT62565.1 hypothetical protein BHC57_01135 [Snodgrassella alvi]